LRAFSTSHPARLKSAIKAESGLMACANVASSNRRLLLGSPEGFEIGEAVHLRPGHIFEQTDNWSTPVRIGETNADLQKVVVGAMVDYFSTSNDCWVPAVISHVDAESGDITLDIKGGTSVPRSQLKQVLRRRNRPDRECLNWMQRILRNGQVEEEAHSLFRRFCHRSAGASPLLLEASMKAAGEKLDAMLGVSGSMVMLKSAVKVAEGPLDLEEFTQLFWDLFTHVQNTYVYALNLKSRACKENPSRTYNFEKELGRGTYGIVYLASAKGCTGRKRAIKIIGRSSFESLSDKFCSLNTGIDDEIAHLRTLDHPNIVKLYEHYEHDGKIYLVMDFCEGSTVQELISTRQKTHDFLEEPFVVNVMRRVLQAIAHVHARGIIHLDLKGANVMLMPSKGNEGAATVHGRCYPHAMVIDLGVARIFRPGDFENNAPRGTPSTMAPEVWQGQLTPKADIFSIGAMMFEMFALSPPFNCNFAHKDQALRYWHREPSPFWSALRHASDAAVSICKQMLYLKRQLRPTAAQCLKSPLFREDSEFHLTPMPHSLLERLIKIPERTSLERCVALQIARSMPPDQLPTIQRIFQELDIEGSGILTKTQVKHTLCRFGIAESTAKQVADTMDFSRDGTIDWSEFVACCLNLGSQDMEEELKRIFEEADADNDGYLGQSDLAKITQDTMCAQAVRDLFENLASQDRSARIGWESFRSHFCTTEYTEPGLEMALLSLEASAAEHAEGQVSPEAQVMTKKDKIIPDLTTPVPVYAVMKANYLLDSKGPRGMNAEIAAQRFLAKLAVKEKYNATRVQKMCDELNQLDKTDFWQAEASDRIRTLWLEDELSCRKQRQATRERQEAKARQGPGFWEIAAGLLKATDLIAPVLGVTDSSKQLAKPDLEENLKLLADMGLSEEARNRAALQANGNIINEQLIESLLTTPTTEL